MAIDAVTTPVVKLSIPFAWVTVNASEIKMASSPKLSTPADPYNVVTSAYVPDNSVIALASIFTVVFALIVLNSAAVLPVASADEITIV